MKNRSEYGLVGDIGGTHVRFGLSPLGGRRVSEDTLTAVKAVKGARYASFEEAVRAYLSGLSESEVPAMGCIAIAGPVAGERIRLTNMAWHFSRQELQEALGFSKLMVINDYYALASALPHLSANGRLKIGGGVPVDDKMMAVVGPGSGLGVSGLLPTMSGPVAIDSEGGHISYAPVNDFETEMTGILRKRFGRISNERLLSGPGIELIYQTIAQILGQTPEAMSAPDICRKAVEGTSEICREALEIFCGILGSVAGDIALAMGAKGGVYIAGGIVPRFVDFFENSDFRRRFEDKGRFYQYMTSIPTYVITSPYPGLLGAAVALNQQALN